jgi:hypothetical protein
VTREPRSEAQGELIERSADSIVDGPVDGEFVVAATQVLHQRMPGRDGAERSDCLEPAHRAQSGLEPAMIGCHAVVGVLLEDMARARHEFIDHPVHRCSVGGDLDRCETSL